MICRRYGSADASYNRFSMFVRCDGCVIFYHACHVYVRESETHDGMANHLVPLCLGLGTETVCTGCNLSTDSSKLLTDLARIFASSFLVRAPENTPYHSTENPLNAFGRERVERRDSSIPLRSSMLIDFDDSVIAPDRVSQCPALPIWLYTIL